MSDRLRAALVALVAVAMSPPAAAEDTRWSFPKQYTVSPKGVNLQTGRFIYSKVDLSIGSLQFKRNWGDVPALAFTGRSLGALGVYSEAPVLGFATANTGWSHNFNSGVVLSNMGNGLARIAVVVEGRQYSFATLVDGSVIPAEQGSTGTMLVWNNGQWNFTDRSGATYVFYAHPAISQPDALGSNQVLQSATTADGSRVDYSYDPAGRPIFIKDSRGYALALDYDGNGNVSAACGYNIAVAFADASTGCTGAGLKSSYSYDGTGNKLASVTDTLGRVVTMSYVTSPGGFAWVTCISKPNASACEITNAYGATAGAFFNYADQVNTQTTAEGHIWRYAFRGPPDPQDVPVVPGLPRYSVATMTDAENRVYSFRYDRGHLTRQITPGAIYTEYRYPYQQFTLPLSPAVEPTVIEYHGTSPRLVEFPEGNREYVAHDNRGNIVAHSYWPKGSPNPATHPDPRLSDCCIAVGTPAWPAGSVTFTRTYLADYGAVTAQGFVVVLGCGSGPADAKLCDKPQTMTDARNNMTEFTYATAHGGVLTETGPAVNGVRPQTRYSYVQRQAWVKAPGSGYIQTGVPMWLLSAKSLCRTGAANASGTGCALPGDEVETTYDYGPDTGTALNNLQLRGTVEDASGVALRTCYSYDGFGNRVSETKPRAGLTSCP